MNTVTLNVVSSAEIRKRLRNAFKGRARGSVVSFETPALLCKVLTQTRWELLAAMQGAGPMSLREAARRAGRDVKAVHGDVHALLDAGILRRNADGQIVFPFDAVRVDFLLRAA